MVNLNDPRAKAAFAAALSVALETFATEMAKETPETPPLPRKPTKRLPAQPQGEYTELDRQRARNFLRRKGLVT